MFEARSREVAIADSVLSSLHLAVADSDALIGQIHHCHRNVRGTDFFSLRAAFEQQYSEFAAADEVAEHIRATGAIAPCGLNNLSRMAPSIPHDRCRGRKRD